MPKLRSPRRFTSGAKWKAELPPERAADVGFVWNGLTGRVVAPWRRDAPLTPEEHDQLLAVLARVDTLRPRGIVWIWPDPAREPEPVTADNASQWADRWGEDRAVYVARRAGW